MMDQVRVSRVANGTHSPCHTMQRSRDQSSYTGKAKLPVPAGEQYFGAMRSVNKVLATEGRYWVTGTEIYSSHHARYTSSQSPAGAWLGFLQRCYPQRRGHLYSI